MYSYVAALAIAGSASALVMPRQDGCCFEMKAYGEQSGTIGQLDDGQNRIGGGLSPATYCINGGAITDSNGRGCILTPPTSQFQCDEGATPTGGFSVSGEGEVQYNGSSKFYACGADQDEYNIYTKPVEGQKDCVEVTLSSSEGKCSGNGGGGGEGATSSASKPAESAASSKPAGGQSTAPAESAAPKPSSSAPASPSAPGSSEKASQSETPGYYQSQPSAPATSAPAPSAPASSAPAPSAPAPAPSAPAPAPSAPAPSVPAESAPAECHPDTVTVTVTQPCESSQQTGNTGVPGGGSPPVAPSGGATGGAGPSSYGVPKPSSGAQTSNGAQGGAGPSSYGGPKPSSGAQPSGNVPQPSSNGGVSSAQGSTTSEATVPVTSTVVKSSEKPSQPAVSTAPDTGSASKAVPSVGSGFGSGSSAASSKAPSASAPAPYPTASSAEESSAPIGTGSASWAASSTQGTGTGTASGSACQTNLSGAYQTPHLIVPVSSDQPDEAFGTNYNGQINETTSTIFNFDIPQDYEGKQCSIIFLFPKKEDLETSDYEFGGSGSLGCSELSSAADEQTSYSNAPSVDSDLGTIDLKTGNSYVVATQDCKAGTTQAIELSSKDGLDLNFFEDWNPSPLGLYITSC